MNAVDTRGTKATRARPARDQKLRQAVVGSRSGHRRSTGDLDLATGE